MRYLLATFRPVAEDLAGTVAYYLLFVLTGAPRLAAAVGLALGLAQVGRHRWRGERVPALLATGCALTVVLGGATLVLNDPRFLLLKPSIVYLAIAATMLPRGWVRRYVPTVAHDLLPAGAFNWIGWSWAALLLATAVLNLALVATLPPREAALTFVLAAAATKLLLFAGQYALLYPRAAATARARQRTPSSASSRS